MTENILHGMASHCGLTFTDYKPVTGGDINEAYCLYAGSRRYFLKMNDAAAYPYMFEMEADGLEALRSNSALVIPHIIKYGVLQTKQWLMLQWIEKDNATKNSLAQFGVALASMHLQPQTAFGWPRHNYIGSLQQINTQHNNWPAFYTQCRILPLVKILFDEQRISKQDLANATAFCKRAGDLFPNEPPAMLHGDLWSGNYMIAEGGKVCIYDPAVYCGHREMDLGMTKLFGGFGQPFYDAYHEAYPLEQNWLQRLSLTQLYPLLVHAVLFGGHYVSAVKEIIRKY